MAKLVGVIVAIISIIAAFFTSYQFVDNRYALKKKLILIENRLERKIINDDLTQLQNRIWNLEDRLDERPNDKTLKEEIRLRKCEKDDLDKKLEILRNKM